MQIKCSYFSEISTCPLRISDVKIDLSESMIYKYVDRKGSAALLTSIDSAGVAPEMNLRITQARKLTSKGSTLALKPRADVTRSLKQGYQWPHEKDLCPPKLKKKIHLCPPKFFLKNLSGSSTDGG